MDRETIVTLVKEDCGIDTDEISTLCHNHIDRVQDRIASGMYYEDGIVKTHDPSWLIDYAEINTTPTYTTGTVAITQDSTTVTGTSTVWDDHVGWLMVVDGGDEYYEVSEVGSNTDITLTSAYIGDTVTTATYVLYKIYYPLATTFKQMKWIKQVITPQRVVPLTEFEMGEFYPDEFRQTGELAGYIHSGQNSSGVNLIRFLPFQTTRKRVYYCYEKDLATINTTGAESIIPSKWHMLFVFGLNEVIWKRHDRPNKVQEAKDNFNEMMVAMVKEDKKISKDKTGGMMDELIFGRRMRKPQYTSTASAQYPEIY